MDPDREGEEMKLTKTENRVATYNATFEWTDIIEILKDKAGVAVPVTPPAKLVGVTKLGEKVDIDKLRLTWESRYDHKSSQWDHEDRGWKKTGVK
jgi:hypothetical protein